MKKLHAGAALVAGLLVAAAADAGVITSPSYPDMATLTGTLSVFVDGSGNAHLTTSSATLDVVTMTAGNPVNQVPKGTFELDVWLTPSFLPLNGQPGSVTVKDGSNVVLAASTSFIDSAFADGGSGTGTGTYYLQFSSPSGTVAGAYQFLNVILTAQDRLTIGGPTAPATYAFVADTFPTTPVPEPATLTVLAGGAALLLTRRMKRD